MKRKITYIIVSITTIIFLCNLLYVIAKAGTTQNNEVYYTEDECSIYSKRVMQEVFSGACNSLQNYRSAEQMATDYYKKCGKYTAKDNGNHLASCYSLLAVSLYEDKDYKNTAIFMQASIDIEDPINGIYPGFEKFILADSYVNIGEYSKAKPFIDDVIAEKNPHFTHYEVAGDVYYGLGNKLQAKKYYQLSKFKLEDLIWQNSNNPYISIEAKNKFQAFAKEKMYKLDTRLKAL